MTIEITTVLAKTAVDLATIAMLAYGIKAAKDFLNHWLDAFPRREHRTPAQVAQDDLTASVYPELMDHVGSERHEAV